MQISEIIYVKSATLSCGLLLELELRTQRESQHLFVTLRA